MKEPQNYILDFEVDKLTNSIENVLTGEKFSNTLKTLKYEINKRASGNRFTNQFRKLVGKGFVRF